MVRYKHMHGRYCPRDFPHTVYSTVPKILSLKLVMAESLLLIVVVLSCYLIITGKCVEATSLGP